MPQVAAIGLQWCGVHQGAVPGSGVVEVMDQLDARIVILRHAPRPRVVVADHGQAQGQVFEQFGGGLLGQWQHGGHEVQAGASTQQLRGHFTVGDAACAVDMAQGLESGLQFGGHIADEQQAQTRLIDGVQCGAKGHQSRHGPQVDQVKFGSAVRLCREEMLRHAHVAQAVRDRVQQPHALAHPFALEDAVVRARVCVLFDAVFEPSPWRHAGGGVFVHVHAAVQVQAVCAADVAADPPDHGGIIGHSVCSGMHLAAVAEGVQVRGVGRQLGQVGRSAVNEVHHAHAASSGVRSRARVCCKN